MNETFIIGNLYWHKYPYDEWENEYYYDYASGDWRYFPLDKHGRQCHMLLFLGINEVFNNSHGRGGDYGDFIFEDKKIAVKMDDLCMVDLSDKYHRHHIRKYGDK